MPLNRPRGPTNCFKFLLGLKQSVPITKETSNTRYQVLRIDADSISPDNLRKVVDELNLDVWAEHRDWYDVMVGPQHRDAVRRRLVRHGATADIKIENVQT